MNANTTLNLLDEQAVCDEMQKLIEAKEFDKVQVLYVEHACAKQRHELETAEAKYLASLTPEARARRIAIGRVNLGSKPQWLTK